MLHANVTRVTSFGSGAKQEKARHLPGRKPHRLQ
jgi:hypothetical protein